MQSRAAHIEQNPAGLLSRYSEALEVRLADGLDAEDEDGLDGLWREARQSVREYVLRPAKRVRPALLTLGWLMARPEGFRDGVPEALLSFGAGLELLHTFMLVHDDVADRATTRRGGAALHEVFGGGKHGDDLAVVAGDHLYARAVELMLSAPEGVQATRYMLEVCRHTAAGQHLDLVLARAPLSSVTLFRTLKVADLKTARYGFVAPRRAGRCWRAARRRWSKRSSASGVTRASRTSCATTCWGSSVTTPWWARPAVATTSKASERSPWWPRGRAPTTRVGPSWTRCGRRLTSSGSARRASW